MKIFILLKILFVINVLFLSDIGFSYAQDSAKVKDSTDTTLADGVRQIQKSQDEIVIEKNADGTIEVDLGENTEEDINPFVDTERPEPRITLEEQLSKPLYQPFGKRDPFKPFIKEPKENEATISETTPPIKRFPLDEYRIVGIVWVENVPKAMVVDPEKNTYFLGKTDEIGNKNGIILEVSENGLLVNEKRFFEDVFGEQKVEIKKSVLAFAGEEDGN
jgi:Tfp pilus assembly protein PilP